MAIRIRTGANGSYKSSYVAYFTVFEALKAGRIVVTNISGMQPLEEIEKRFDVVFPSTAKLIRIFSRNAEGLELWQYFFCWAPIGALIVIDECQDIFSKNIGFDLRKIMYRPLSCFLDKLPKDYENLFNSRHIPVDLSDLNPSDVDDCGKAEYDDDGRILYPFSFNEGFMRHRHYNWDIELLSPDWRQIDSGIKACAEECFFHKGRDGYFWLRRKPYIFKHDKSVSAPSIPRSRDPNLFSKKIPLDAFLLYKSTSTGQARDSGQMNVLFSNPKLMSILLLLIFCMGVFIYGVSNLVFGSSSSFSASNSSQVVDTVSNKTTSLDGSDSQVDPSLSDRRDSDSSYDSSSVSSHRLESLQRMLTLPDILGVYYTGYTTRSTKNGFDFYVTLQAVTPEGVYNFSDTFLTANNISYVHYDDCLLKLTKDSIDVNVFCKPSGTQVPDSSQSSPQVKLF